MRRTLSICNANWGLKTSIDAICSLQFIKKVEQVKIEYYGRKDICRFRSNQGQIAVD
jgi:hypothetical protein